MTSHICEIKKKPNSWKQKVECWLPGTEGQGKWEDVGQRTQTSSYEMNKFWGRLTYSMGIIVLLTIS